MQLAPRHIIALIANLALAAIALTDAVVHAITGQYSVFSDDSGNLAAQLAADLIHGLAYASLVFVLWRERPRFAQANRLARMLRIILIVLLAILTAGFLIVSPLVKVFSPPADSPILGVWGLVATIAFLGMMLVAATLGLSLLRRNPLGLGARILLGVIPAIALVIVLGFIAPDAAHPGIVELVVGVGIALLGVVTTGADAPEDSISAAPTTSSRNII